MRQRIKFSDERVCKSHLLDSCPHDILSGTVSTWPKVLHYLKIYNMYCNLSIYVTCLRFVYKSMPVKLSIQIKPRCFLLNWKSNSYFNSSNGLHCYSFCVIIFISGLYLAACSCYCYQCLIVSTVLQDFNSWAL